MGNTFFEVSRSKNKNGKPQSGGTDIDSEDDPQLEKPSCYSLLAFLGAMGLYPVKDLEYAGMEIYLRGKLSAAIPFTVEWDLQGNTDFNIDFSKATFAAVYDIVKKLSGYGINFSNANFKSVDDIVEKLSVLGVNAQDVTLAAVDEIWQRLSDRKISGVFEGRLGTFSLSKKQFNTAVLLHDRREHAKKQRNHRKPSGSLALPHC